MVLGFEADFGGRRWLNLHARSPGWADVRRRGWFGGRSGRAALVEELTELKEELEEARDKEGGALWPRLARWARWPFAPPWSLPGASANPYVMTQGLKPQYGFP